MLLALLFVLATPHTFTVPGLTCPTCEDPVRKTLALTPGVTKVLVDWRKQSVMVEFDEDVTSPKALGKVLTDAGFPAVNEGSSTAKHTPDIDWIRPRGRLAAEQVKGKATVFAFTTTDCAPCEALKQDLNLLAARVERVAIRFVKLESVDDPLYSLLPKNPGVPYTLVFGPKGKQHYAGTPTKAGEVYTAIEIALGINPDGSPRGDEDRP